MHDEEVNYALKWHHRWKSVDDDKLCKSARYSEVLFQRDVFIDEIGKRMSRLSALFLTQGRSCKDQKVDKELTIKTVHLFLTIIWHPRP